MDDKEGNLGVLSLTEALSRAKEKELDLIEIAPTAKPPVAKIMDYGKFQYQEQRKLKVAKKKVHTTETKAIQIGLSTGLHDLELKAKKASAFLKEGHRVKVSIILKGRAKYLARNFINERIDRVLNLVTEEHKVSQEARKGPRGIHLIIESAGKTK